MNTDTSLWQEWAIGGDAKREVPQETSELVQASATLSELPGPDRLENGIARCAANVPRRGMRGGFGKELPVSSFVPPDATSICRLLLRNMH